MAFQRSHHGQASTEMGLAVALVAVVALPTLMLFGDSLFSNMGDMKTTMTSQQGHLAIVEPLPDISTGPTPGPAGNTVTQSVVGGTSNVTMTLNSGKTISLQGVPTDLQKLVETAGVNGSSAIALAQLDELIAQLQASNEADTNTLNQLKALSNHGHRIANVESLLEVGMSQISNSSQLTGYQASFEGRTYNLSELSNLIGYEIVVTATMKDTGSLYGANAIQKDFVSTYNTLKTTSPLMKNASINAVVTKLVDDINILAETSEHVVSMTENGEVTPGQYVQTAASEQTLVRTISICDIGNGNDNGLVCQ
ncbi:MAG: hypothetical protein AB7P76_01255 [Candidatus Melainabacteria bacterium]